MPLLGGFISTFVGVVIMAFSPFLFVTKYFFALFMYILVYSLINAMFFLPVMLAAFGPTHDFDAKPHLATNQRLSLISIRNNAGKGISFMTTYAFLCFVATRLCFDTQKPGSGHLIVSSFFSNSNQSELAKSVKEASLQRSIRRTSVLSGQDLPFLINSINHHPLILL